MFSADLKLWRPANFWPEEIPGSSPNEDRLLPLIVKLNCMICKV